MTLNNLDLCEQMRVLMKNYSCLELYIRNGQLGELAKALDRIHDASRQAGWIVNDILRPPP